MGLGEFLKHHGASAGVPQREITEWRAAVSVLIGRFKSILGRFEQLELLDWNVLREHAGIRYNADALTIAFGESFIRLEPNTIAPESGVLGRASLNCGVREVHLDCGHEGKLWRYHWVIPHDPSSAELTDEAIETLVEELFKS